MSELAGIPIEGDINPTHKVVDQDPIDYWIDAIKGVFTTGVVKAVRWYQYTPYFNDGDECVFGIGEVYYRFVDLDDEVVGGDYEDGFLGAYDDRYAELLGGSKYDEVTRKFTPVEGADPVTAALVRELKERFNSGRHEVELGRIFGDHAKVTATPDKFIVDYYEHD
jgi:hypothetical protein